jgi:transposase
VQVKYEMVRRVEADGVSVSAAAGAFGFSRQSYYSAARALADEGLAGLVPAKPGPRGAHKLTDEVLEYLEGLREADPEPGAPELAAAVAERFRVTVHRRSVERALARRRPPSGARKVADEDESSGDASAFTAEYERLRAAVLSGSASGWRLGHGVLSARGITAWMSAFGELAPPVIGGTGAAGPGARLSSESCDGPSAQTVSLPGADEVVAVLAQMVLPLAA